MPTLLAGAKTSPDGHSRIINTASFAADGTSSIDFNTLRDSPARVRKGKSALYNQSKLVRRLPLS
jgi:retinol dehydrogenase-12